MKTIKRSIFISFILLISISLVGCGFHLRGRKPLPPSLHTIYIESADPYSKLTLQLKQVMHSLGVVIVKDPQDAPITLKLFKEIFKSETLSESASATTKEYTLSFEASFQLQNKAGEIIYGPRTIKTSRNLVVLEDEVLSSGNEKAVLNEDMQRDVMYQMVGQLSSEDVANILDSNELSLPTDDD